AIPQELLKLQSALLKLLKRTCHLFLLSKMGVLEVLSGHLVQVTGFQVGKINWKGKYQQGMKRAVQKNWQVQAYALETCNFSGQHTADNNCAELKIITDEWGIIDKIQAVITDNGANMVAA
ncbi:hypothetical protein DNTS_033516, partial [Danionella cerebrum]